MSDLLPCPFCGEPEELYQAHHGMGGGKPYAIDCLGCGMDFTPRAGTDVVAAWNRRPAAASPAEAELGPGTTPDTASLQSLQRQLEEAREALRPFAEAWVEEDPHHPGDRISLPMGALSKASQVLVLVEGWSNSAQSQPVAMTPKSASAGSGPSAASEP